MSQIVTRNSAVAEEKDKPKDSPAKDMKKKIAASEKEKQTTDNTDKTADKNDKNDKPDKHDNPTDKGADKKADKKSETQTDKTKEDSNKAEKTVKEKPKDGKVQKVKEDLPATDRKLRSADSPKPTDRKSLDKLQEPAKKLKEKTPEPAAKKAQDSPKKTQDSPKKMPGSPKKAPESPKKTRDGSKSRETESKTQEEKENGVREIEVDVEILVDSDGSQDEPRKLDTNYSKSRVKVSPYRRSMRLADQTTSSVMANYTGNNTTMEMDITETSSYVSIAEEPSVVEGSPYLSGLRNIRGRRSYKPLKEMALKHVAADRSARSTNISVADLPSRPTGTVVGRKRKPDGEEIVEKLDLATESDDLASVVRSKRMRLLDRIAHPFKRTLASTPIPRRAAEIVGINTDLPLTAPVDPEPFDPESLKPAAVAAEVTSETTDLTQATEKDGKRCIVM